MKISYKKNGYSYVCINEWVVALEKEYGNQDVFLCEKDKTIEHISYKQFHEHVKKCAFWISKQYDDNVHIGIVCKNNYDCFLLIMSVIYAGRTAVLLDGALDECEINKLAQAADCVDVISNELVDINSIIRLSGENSIQDDLFNNKSNHPAIIYFTSGTTGNKMMVVISHGNITSAVHAGRLIIQEDKGLVSLANLPLFHMYGFMSVLWNIDYGSVVAFNQSMKYLGRNLKKYSPVGIETVPMVIEYFYKKVNTQIEKRGKKAQVAKGIKLCKCLRLFGIDIRKKVFADILSEFGGKLDLIISGGAALNPEIIEFFDNIGITIVQGYGMTETSTFCTVCSQKYNRVGSVGIAAPYNEIRIKEGEIQVSGPNVMMGYYKNDEATRNAFDDGWLKTGDLGYIDKNGFLYITGRKKNLIILSNGENVSPEIIENELLKSEWISEVIVKEKQGHIHAEIYSVNESQESFEELTAHIKNEIDTYNRKKQGMYKVDSFELRKEPFEKTSTMKIIRKTEK